MENAQIYLNVFLVERKTTHWFLFCQKNKNQSIFSLPTGQHAPNAQVSASSEVVTRLAGNWANPAAGQTQVASSFGETNERLRGQIFAAKPRSWGNITAPTLRSLRWQRKARRIDPNWSREETGPSVQAAAACPRVESRLSDCRHNVSGGKIKEIICSTKRPGSPDCIPTVI